MKLIRRRKKKQQTPFERATGFVKLGVKGLAAQRVLRRGLKGYRFTKRAVPLAGLGAIGLFLSKKLRGGGSETPSYSAPSTPATPSAPPADASHTDETLDVEAPNQSTPPPPEEATATSET